MTADLARVCNAVSALQTACERAGLPMPVSIVFEPGMNLHGRMRALARESMLSLVGPMVCTVYGVNLVEYGA